MNTNTLIKIGKNVGLALAIVAIFGAVAFLLLQPSVVVPVATEEQSSSSALYTSGNCGNGTADAGEQCDDGNPWVGDGCTQCQIEAGFSCMGVPSVCKQGTLCGNSQADPGEYCDDGNTSDKDGCSQSCTIEEGFTCDGLPSVCVHASSSSISSNMSSMMSSSTSTMEHPAAPPEPKEKSMPSSASASAASSVLSSSAAAKPQTANAKSSVKRYTPREIQAMKKAESESSDSPYYHIQYDKPHCGDELVLNEQCDDGNTEAGDGCSATCTIESGFSCSGNPSVCKVSCGDGVAAGSESCDDGNLTDSDGCSSSCHLEMGYACSNAKPNVCTLLTPESSASSSES